MLYKAIGRLVVTGCALLGAGVVAVVIQDGWNR